MEFENLAELEQMIPTLDQAELRPIQIGSSSPESYVAIWNTTKDQLETVVLRKNSTLIQHNEAFGSFARTCENRKIDVKGKLLNLGGQVVIEAIFKGVKMIDDGSEQGIELGVRFENNYDHKESNREVCPNFRGEAFGNRLVCSNGMVMRRVLMNVFQKHGTLAEMDKTMNEFIEKVVSSADTMKIIIDTAKQEKFVDAEDAMNMLRYFMGKKKVKDVVTLFESQELDRYTIYNGITNYATHQSRSEKERQRLQNAAQRVLLTPVVKLPRRVDEWAD